MTNESTPSHRVLNPLPDIDFDVRDPNGWHQIRIEQVQKDDPRGARIHPPLSHARIARGLHAQQNPGVFKTLFQGEAATHLQSRRTARRAEADLLDQQGAKRVSILPLTTSPRLRRSR